MNKQNRKDLSRAIKLISEAKTILDSVMEEEQEKFDNMPENLQESEKAFCFEQNVSDLESAIDELEGSMDHINETSER